jgi:hypothetical protein
LNFNVLNRKVHYWASVCIALPLLVMILSGLLLQSKKHWSWVQPHERRGTGTMPAISLEHVLESVKQVPELGVTGWADVNRLDVRPGRGMVKVWLHSGYEARWIWEPARCCRLPTGVRISSNRSMTGRLSPATGPSLACFFPQESLCS